MSQVVIRPHRLRQFGPAESSVFCLVTNSDLVDRFTIEKEGSSYSDYRVVTFDQGQNFNDMLERELPEPSHILAVSPNCFFQSPNPAKVGQRKLLQMACNSTPTPLEAVAHFLKVIEDTDPSAQAAFADRFFELGQASERLELVDDAYGTSATFDHLNESYEWHQQAGPLNWGDQQIAPSGEISVLPLHIIDFDASLRLGVNGEIAFKGLPILHNGTPSFLREDQARIHSKLMGMAKHAVIATVENGTIVATRASHPGAEPAVEMLETIFEVDSRYRIVWEMGFAINTTLELLPGNFAMNEVYGADNGALHWGLGLTPYTQYHLDIICPGTSVLGLGGEVIFGAARGGRKAKGQGMVRKIGAGCPCLE